MFFLLSLTSICGEKMVLLCLFLNEGCPIVFLAETVFQEVLFSIHGAQHAQRNV